jgi:two-component system nitrate/nitrite response regulator NarL
VSPGDPGRRPRGDAGEGAGAALRVALRLADPEASARLAAALPGAARVEDVARAEVVVAEAAAAGAPVPDMAEAPPTVVLAEGAAALRALRAGARAVLPPDASAAELGAVLPAVARGLAVLPPGLLAGLVGRGAAPPDLPAGGLTPREREVLALLADGASNKVIARRLGLSFHTAKAHVAAVLQKLGAGSRADAVARGARAGLVLL